MKTAYLYRLLPLLATVLAWGVASESMATCSFQNGTSAAIVQFTIPPLVVNSDTAPGTILTTVSEESSSTDVLCNSTGQIWQGYRGLVDSDLRTDNPLADVYQTNVPGIGFRAAWANNNSPKLTAGNLITPWHKGSSNVTKGALYAIKIHAVIQFVVTGPVATGTIDTSQLTADWQYDNLPMGQLRFNSVQVDIQPGTCSLVDKNITVPLKDIGTNDFDTNGISPIVSDSRFKISLEKCAKDMQVDYRFTSAGSTGVTNNTILNIATGVNAAAGVGIQILDANDNLLAFDTDHTANAKTTQDQAFSIPLKARYIKTGNVKSGKVAAVATFEVYYR